MSNPQKVTKVKDYLSGLAFLGFVDHNVQRMINDGYFDEIVLSEGNQLSSPTQATSRSSLRAKFYATCVIAVN